MTRVAVALSGGGHRACIFGLGVLLYLADAGRCSQLTSVASVSGGSLANGALAQDLDIQTADSAAVEASVGRVARQIAQRGTLFAVRSTWLYLVALALLTLAVLMVPWFLPIATAAQVLILVAGLLVVSWVAGERGRVCGHALGKTLFSEGGHPKRLADVHLGADHVICATDLHAGEDVYFSGGFVYSYRFGLGDPGDLPLHTAVQASAAFPGAFPATWLRLSPFAFQGAQPEAEKATRLALHDGGVYDNMGDQWAQGLAKRSGLRPDAGFQLADELVVASASAGLGWGSVMSLRLPLVGEIFTLLRDKSVLYDNGNSVRRQQLVARFDLADRQHRGLRGALVHIPQSPFDVPDKFVGAAADWPERARRAEDARATLIGDAEDGGETLRREWRADCDANAAVHTTLRKLGPAVTARLLHQAYVLAMVNLHVILNYPLLPLPDRQRFLDLVDPSPGI